MKHYPQAPSRTVLSGVCMIVFGLGSVVPTFSYDPTQSTGTGTVQGKDGSMTTQRGGNTGPNTGRNEDSGSATGAVRNPNQPEPDQEKNRDSSQRGSDSRPDASHDEGRGQAGVRTDK